MTSLICRGLIGPSVLACDLSNLTAECRKVLAGGADYIHLDVMDGHFVPNISFGAPVIKSLRGNMDASVSLDVHLMVTYPSKWVNDMSDAGANAFTFHIEVEEDIPSLIASIKAKGMKVGVAVKPNTPASALLPYMADIDQVLVMTVEPGFGGQSFMPAMLDKIREIRSGYPHMNLMVDGGIGLGNIDQVAKAGANMIVAGTSVFKAADPSVPIAALRKSLNENGFN